MTTIKIKADKELFDRWQRLGWSIHSQAGIVQNDMEIDSKEITEFKNRIAELVDLLHELKADTLVYIIDNKEMML